MSKEQTLLRAGVQILSLNQEITETPQIKEEPEEQSVKQEEEQLPVSVPEFITVCVKAEESSGDDLSSETEGHSENSHDSDNDYDWEPMETAAVGEQHSQIQTRGRSSKLPFRYRSTPETSASVQRALSGAEGAEKKIQRKKHQCSVCKKKFGTKQILQRHGRVHTGEKPYTCSVCEKAFALKGNLQIHIMRTHSGENSAGGAEGKKHQCSLCIKRFWTKRDLVKHTRVHTGEKPYSCSVCKKGFGQKGHLDAHKRTHTEDSPGLVLETDEAAERQKHQCPFCQKTLSSKQGLLTHTRVHTGDTPYSCSLCEKAYCYESKLKLHMRTHTGEKPYSCPACKATLATSNALKVHMRTHTGEKPFSCSLCMKTFMYKINRDRHLETHTEKLYSCSFCTTTFGRKDDLNTHIKTHRGDITINGFNCKMDFSDSSVHKEQTKTHSEEKPSSCVGSLFERRTAESEEEEKQRKQQLLPPRAGDQILSDLNQEITETPQIKEEPEEQSVKQEEEQLPVCVPESSAAAGAEGDEGKKEECPICHKRFGRKDVLQRHIRSHSGEKPHSCSICDKTFTRKYILLKHVRTHAGDKHVFMQREENVTDVV